MQEVCGVPNLGVRKKSVSHKHSSTVVTDVHEESKPV